VAPGALIDIYTDNGQQNQQWVIEPSSGGYCTVQGVQSGLMLDVQGNHTAPGTPVDQWTSTGANNQQWEFESP
jgi:hypothetical protein